MKSLGDVILAVSSFVRSRGPEPPAFIVLDKRSYQQIAVYLSESVVSCSTLLPSRLLGYQVVVIPVDSPTLYVVAAPDAEAVRP